MLVDREDATSEDTALTPKKGAAEAVQCHSERTPRFVQVRLCAGENAIPAIP